MLSAGGMIEKTMYIHTTNMGIIHPLRNVFRRRGALDMLRSVTEKTEGREGRGCYIVP